MDEQKGAELLLVRIPKRLQNKDRGGPEWLEELEIKNDEGEPKKNDRGEKIYHVSYHHKYYDERKYILEDELGRQRWDQEFNNPNHQNSIDERGVQELLKRRLADPYLSAVVQACHLLPPITGAQEVQWRRPGGLPRPAEVGPLHKRGRGSRRRMPCPIKRRGSRLGIVTLPTL